MKNITAPLYWLPQLLMALFFSIPAAEAFFVNDSSDISSPFLEIPDFSFDQQKSPGVLFADTFPLFSIFKKQKKEKIVETEPSTSLFPNSKSYRKPYECKVVFDGIDPVTGERKKELAPEPLISYTAPNLKPYLPGKDLLEASAQLIRLSGGYIYLSIKFDWNAQNPNASYGRLKANGAIRCHLTGEKSVTLYNTKESIWHKTEHVNRHTLQALYLIHPKQIKLLKEYSMMKLTVYWEKGYEEYPVYPITLFMNQLKCLE